MTNRLAILAEMIRSGANLADVDADLLDVAADLVGAGREASAAEARAERNDAILKCLRLFYPKAFSPGSFRGRVLQSFLDDIRQYQGGRWRRDRGLWKCPAEYTGRRESQFFLILHSGAKLPDLRRLENLLGASPRIAARRTAA